MPTHNQQYYFDFTIHHPRVKDCISGKNEKMVISVLENFLGYKSGVDFIRQYPIGNKFVLDFAFVPEQLAIEIDGNNHKYAKQKSLDRLRDNFLYEVGWVVIRIPDEKFAGRQHYFYTCLIKDVIEERKRQLKNYELTSIEIPDFTN